MLAFSVKTIFDPDNFPNEVSLIKSLQEGAETTASYTWSTYTTTGDPTTA